jgi:hypothetical protein
LEKFLDKKRVEFHCFTIDNLNEGRQDFLYFAAIYLGEVIKNHIDCTWVEDDEDFMLQHGTIFIRPILIIYEKIFGERNETINNFYYTYVNQDSILISNLH